MTTSTGEVFTLGGSWSGGIGNKNGEVWSAAGGWRTLPNVLSDNILTDDPRGEYTADNHSWLFAAPGGRVFHAGPSRQMNWISTTGKGSITSAGLRSDSPDAMNGDAVMYDVGKILTVGGATAYNKAPGTARAYTIDINNGVKVTRTADLAFARSFANGVALPDGQVFVVGGQATASSFNDTSARMAPEIWNPATGKWTTLAPMAIPRTYHSVALLLPDGRVFVGGGGLCGNCTTNHLDGEIFTPPYLLNPDGSARTRPTIVDRTGHRRGRQHDQSDHGSAGHQVFPDADEHGDPHREHRPAAHPADRNFGVGQHRVAEATGGPRRAGAGNLPALRHGRQRGAQRRLDDQDHGR